MFGCHNCQIKIEPDTPYEETPCAKCRTRRDPPPVSKYNEDPATFNAAQIAPEEIQDDSPEELRYSLDDLHTLMKALGQSVRILVQLKEQHPTTYMILDAKMQEPTLSYSELAERFCCRKQNVQYHLRKAVDLVPELAKALIIDSRFCSGKTIMKPAASCAVRG